MILGDGDALEVVDYKTADDARVTSEVQLQLQMYSLGLSESGRKVARAKVIHVLDDSSGYGCRFFLNHSAVRASLL